MKEEIWIKELLDKCHPLKIDILGTKADEKIVFLCPKMPDDETKIELVKSLPKKTDYEFLVGFKESTKIKLRATIEHFGIYSADLKGDKNVIFTVNSKQSEEIVEKLLEALDTIFRDDGYLSSWKITVNDTEKYFYPTITHDTKRECRISTDDIMDLQIALNTCKSFDEFMEKI